MSDKAHIHLYTATAGSGKTTFVLEQARQQARNWGQTRVVTANGRQTVAAYRHLARLGGGMGVRIQTLFGLARELLDRTGSSFTLISDPIQVRFLRSLVDEARLSYYAPLVRKPGFIRALRDLFIELNYALVTPSSFGKEVRRMGEPPRLAELARLYAMYQQRMSAEQWMDTAILLLRAREAVQTAPQLIGQWDFLGIDGFTSFHPAELDLLRAVAARAHNVIITLDSDPSQMHAAAAAILQQTITEVEQTFHIHARPLPHHTSLSQPSLHFVAAPDLIAEVRVALRWLKERILLHGLKPEQTALLARDITPYRHAIARIADEFGMPVHIAGGFSVRSNPAVDALISLLNLLAPLPQNDETDQRFPFRTTLNAWRSPYFDWHWPDDDITIRPQDADALGRLGRWARVTAGVAQWEDAFRRRIQHLGREKKKELDEDEEPGPALPGLDEIKALQSRWEHFRAAISPPQGQRPLSDFVRWLEDLIGAEPTAESQSSPVRKFSLNMVARIRSGQNSKLEDRDIAALVAMKEALRGMVWAAKALHLPLLSFNDFLTDLAGVLEATRYEPLRHAGQGAILALNVQGSAGLRFEAVALLGMAEGSFPAVLSEDVFLRGEDRKKLQEAGLAVAPSPRSEEPLYFYLAMSRSHGSMLLTRPRLAQGGAEWQASPYWHTLLDDVGVHPVAKRHNTMLADEIIASTSELMLALATHKHHPQRPQMENAAGERLAHWQHGRQVVDARTGRGVHIYDGDLSHLDSIFSRRFGSDHIWSAGRLEAYRHCPYRFFAASVLHLEERPQPVLGLDNQQMGKIFHKALELTLRRGAAQADDANALVAIWEELADELLDAAPETYGFRPTVWWPQTREYIKETMRLTLMALAEENKGWRPRAFEAVFGWEGKPILILPHPQRADDALRLRGIIDRVDSDGQGGMRVVDYKRSSVNNYTARALREGKYLQLPLYARAAADALGHGQPRDGFYWSVTQAEPSKLRLAKVGVDEAVEMALNHAWEAIDGARAGRFSPSPPKEGCPDFCPAASFCWHYRPRG